MDGVSNLTVFSLLLAQLRRCFVFPRDEHGVVMAVPMQTMPPGLDIATVPAVIGSIERRGRMSRRRSLGLASADKGIEHRRENQGSHEQCGEHAACLAPPLGDSNHVHPIASPWGRGNALQDYA